ncbi:MAG: sigma-70 family RNA polymerase sigma factor, partial [Nanoarchaeota archaeon]
EKAFHDDFRDKFIANNIGLAMAQSLKYQRSMHSDESHDDLLPIAEIELVRAFDCFDISRGTRFSTAYCTFARNAFIKYSKNKRRHAPNFFRHSSSLDSACGEQDRTRYDSFVHHGNPEVNEIFKKDDSAGVSALVHEALGRLNDRERRVIEARFGLNGFAGKSLTLDATGALIGVSRECARRIEFGTMKKLRAGYLARRAARALTIVD